MFGYKLVHVLGVCSFPFPIMEEIEDALAYWQKMHLMDLNWSTAHSVKLHTVVVYLMSIPKFLDKAYEIGKAKIHLEHPFFLLVPSEIFIMFSLHFLNQASPERSTRTQQKEFQTYVLDSVMDHLLAADVLLGNITMFNSQAESIKGKFTIFKKLLFFINVLICYKLNAFISLLES